MTIHVKIIALIHLLFGTSLGAMFLYGHYHFLAVSSELIPENSITDNSSLFQKLGIYYDVYMNYFAQFDINPLISLFTIVLSISFGYGLLKSREWARKLGFVIIALNTFSSAYGIFTGNVTLTAISQLGLTGYMWWVLTSEETKRT